MRLAVATLLGVALAAPAHAAAPKVKIAVTDIKTVQGVAKGTATILSEIVVSEVARRGYAVISQGDIDSMLGFEKQKQMLGCSEETSCLAEIGGALGVEYLITGQVGKIGSRFRISLLVVDARKAVVVARAAEFTEANEDALAETSEEMVGKLLKEVAELRQASGAAAAKRETKPEPAAVAKAAPPPTAERKPDLEARPREESPVAPATPAERARSARVRGWWMVGGGGALLLIGAGAGLQARSELSKLSDAWRLDPAKYQDEYDSRTKASRTLSIVADTSFVAGVGLAGWGTWMLLRKEPAAVTVAPVPLDGGAGLVAAGSF